LVCGILALAVPSSASIIFEAGGGGTGNNVLFQGTQTGITIFGVLNTPENEQVEFTGNVEISGETAAGQARISSAAANWMSLQILFADFTTNEVIFKVTPTEDALVTVMAWDGANNMFTSLPFDVSSPSGSFLKAIGMDGQTISKLFISSDIPLAEVLQVRVGDVEGGGGGGAVVPEPASVLFMGGGLLALGLVTRYRSTKQRS
jgi:hypothetical protein